MPLQTRSPAKGFLFDLDGVLVDTQHCHLEAYQQVAASFHVSLTEPARALIIAGAARDEVLLALLGSRRHPLWDEMHRRKGETYTRLLAEGRVRVMPGAHASLRTLSLTGLPCGVVSNSRLAERVLETTGLRGFLRVVIDGSQGSAPKPHSGGYLRAAAALGIAPGDCVAFEDAAAGVQAARAAGMRVVAIGPGARNEEADWHWDALSPERLHSLTENAR